MTDLPLRRSSSHLGNPTLILKNQKFWNIQFVNYYQTKKDPQTISGFKNLTFRISEEVFELNVDGHNKTIEKFNSNTFNQ
jgi:hypothetical protein